jgi:transcription-repair coupling factor (superfamily II helicase)
MGVFPLTPDAIARFRNRWHELFDVDVRRCPIYQDVSQGMAPSGIEYYLPMFHDALATVFDYLPANCVAVVPNALDGAITSFQIDLRTRYESLRHDISGRSSARAIYCAPTNCSMRSGVRQSCSTAGITTSSSRRASCPTSLSIIAHHRATGRRVRQRVAGTGVVLRGIGRHEKCSASFSARRLHPNDVADFAAFRSGGMQLGLTIAPIECAALTDALR